MTIHSLLHVFCWSWEIVDHLPLAHAWRSGCIAMSRVSHTVHSACMCLAFAWALRLSPVYIELKAIQSIDHNILLDDDIKT